MKLRANCTSVLCGEMIPTCEKISLDIMTFFCQKVLDYRGNTED